MIRTQIYGISFALLIVLSSISCNTIKNIQKKGIVLEEMYKYYINDSIKFSYRLGGNVDQIISKSNIRNNLLKANLCLPVRNCIACFKTWQNPIPIWLQTTYYIFYFPEVKQTINNKLLGVVKKDTNLFYTDKNRYVIGKFIQLENSKGFVYIISHSGKDGFNSAIKHYDVNNIVINEKYRDIIFTDPFELAREREFYEDSTINYLTPVYLLKKHEQNYTDISSKFIWLQAYGTFVSRITSEQNEIQKSVYKFNNFNNSRENFVSTENFLLANNAALMYLINKCKDEQVVMINENHFAPQHRILGEIFLDSLYNYGFRYLAMEAIWENDTALNERGFAVTNTGMYAREPMMANLIRKALEKGYYVFGYDDFTNEREKKQAINIYNKTLAQDSLSKVLVWAGFGHIDEAKYMAKEFFLLTGINPLTINQTSFVTEEDKFLMVLDTTTIKNKRIACDIFIANNINYDMYAVKRDFKKYNISIPKEIVKQAKVSHLMFFFDSKKDFKNNISKETAKHSKRESLTFLVSIFKTDEYLKDKTAIPVYNHTLNNLSKKISIKLPNDNYYYVLRHRFGKILYQNNL